MRAPVLVSCLIGVMAALSSIYVALAGPSATAEEPRRSPVKCPEYLASTVKRAKSAGIDYKATAGSWGAIPSELRELPPRSSLCGSIDLLGQALVSSPLWGKDIEKFYAPLFAKFACQPFACEVVKDSPYVQTRCECHGKRVHGSVTTDTDSQAFTLALTKF